MAPRPEGPINAGPLPVQMPNITFDIGNLTAEALEERMHAIAKVMNPGLYNAMPTVREDTDDFGTPLDWTQLPDVWDVAQSAREMAMQRAVSPMSMISMRMKWGCFGDKRTDQDDFMMHPVPFEHMSVHVSKEKAVVFIVTKGEPVTITDDKALFPSDALVTQLRMLEERSK